MNQPFRVIAAIFALGLALDVHAEWPDRPIKLIVPYPAANAADVAARIVADKLSTRLGQPIVVDNRAGAAGTLGTAYGATQPSDGYTLMTASPGPMSISPWARAKPLSYDPVKDFVVVGPIAWSPQIIVTGKDSPFTNFKELLAYARKPGVELNYGSSGVGSTGHLNIAQILSQTGIKATHIPYRGGAASVTDVRAGLTNFSSESIPVVRGLLTDGSLKALGISTATKFPTLPNVPTLKEQGINVDTQGFIVLVASAKTPQPIVLRLRAAMQSIMQEPDIRKRLIELGLTPMDLPQERLANFIQTESAKWKKLVELAGISKTLE